METDSGIPLASATVGSGFGHRTWAQVLSLPTLAQLLMGVYRIGCASPLFFADCFAGRIPVAVRLRECLGISELPEVIGI